MEQMKERIMKMADNMAAAATTFNSHGYEVFIQAREDLKHCIEEEVKTKFKEK
jgi:hypothetical protein